MDRLAGKHALITGAAFGIGAEIAQAFAQEGANVTLTDVIFEEGQETVARIQKQGGQATFIEADISQEQEVVWLIDTAIRASGPLHVLVTLPGIWHHRDVSLVDLPLSVWREVLRINLQGPFLCAKYALPRMIAQQQGGSLIFVTAPVTLVGKSPFAPQDASTTATGGLLSLSKSIAAQFRRNQIRSNVLVIAPALLTDHISQLSTEHEQGYHLDTQGSLPSNHPQEIVQAALALAEQTPDFITGKQIIVGTCASASLIESR
jgi:meso-butanediol dehydrogenase/(S,S)-butanediol dehydrogenase/diacetyl reductase